MLCFVYFTIGFQTLFTNPFFFPRIAEIVIDQIPFGRLFTFVVITIVH